MSTSPSPRLWVLGASDPEMEQIERLLTECGEPVTYATMPDGSRVRPEQAYRCLVPTVPAGTTVYAVECDGPAIPADAVRIDHHRPGDPGYGRPPAEFLSASSIGQVISVLARTGQHRWSCPLGALPLSAPGWTFYQGDTPRLDRGAYSYHRECYGWQYPTAREPRVWWIGGWPWQSPQSAGIARVRVPDRIILTAAADHCLAAAYRGECPGVEPDALMRWRIESRAAFQRRAVEDVLADVERARAVLRAAPTLTLVPGLEARDMRGQHVPELPEAAAREGICFISDLPGPDGRVKVVCQSGSPEQIAAFIERWGPAQGLTDIYGDPSRGFAGGYLAARA